jgi:hypothetical protein
MSKKKSAIPLMKELLTIHFHTCIYWNNEIKVTLLKLKKMTID